jgi:hypothetical protein
MSPEDHCGIFLSPSSLLVGIISRHLFWGIVVHSVQRLPKLPIHWTPELRPDLSTLRLPGLLAAILSTMNVMKTFKALVFNMFYWHWVFASRQTIPQVHRQCTRSLKLLGFKPYCIAVPPFPVRFSIQSWFFVSLLPLLFLKAFLLGLYLEFVIFILSASIISCL